MRSRTAGGRRQTASTAKRQHPDPYERLARDRLEPLLGPLRPIDVTGGPPGLHDFEADLPDGSITAIEVTSEVDRARLDLTASAQRRLSGLTLPGSNHCWQVGLAAGARVNAISPGDFARAVERPGRPGAAESHEHRRLPGPVRRAAWDAWHRETVYAFKAKPGRGGTVKVGPGVYSGRGWGRAAIDAWLGSFLASP